MKDSEQINNVYFDQFKEALNEQDAAIVMAIGVRGDGRELVLVAQPHIPKLVLKKTLMNAIQNIEASDGGLN